jgi:hypothetical protein
MSHNPQNCYEEVVVLGDYPIAPRSNDKVLSRKYEQLLLKVLFDSIRQKYPSFNLQPQNYEAFQFTSWKDLGVDFDKVKQDVLDDLAQSLFISENK